VLEITAAGVSILPGDVSIPVDRLHDTAGTARVKRLIAKMALPKRSNYLFSFL